jgi:hypothetical protein
MVSGRIEKTYIKTSSAPLEISPSLSPALTPTNVKCQTSCALEIRLETQIDGLTPPDPNVVAAVVRVDGSDVGVKPTSVLGLDSTSTGGGSNSRSFTWMATELGKGVHVVSVYLFTAEGSAASANRTLVINVVSQSNED